MFIGFQPSVNSLLNFVTKLIFHILFQLARIDFNITSECDKNLINITFNLTNDHIKGTTMNAAFELFKPLENAFVLLEIYLPDSDNDDKYQRQIFRTNADVSKIIKGVRGNFIISLIAESLLSHFDFEVKFPLKEGKYNLVDFDVPSAIFPILPARFKAFVKFSVKIKESRKPKFLISLFFFGKIIQN